MYIHVLTALMALLPITSFGQVTYAPLIEGGGLETSSIGAYINSLYLISISIAALLATVKLIIAGAKYMLSDVVTNQSDAKNEIKASLLGLLLVISAVLILTIINPQIVTNQLTFTRVEPAGAIPEGTGKFIPSANATFTTSGCSTFFNVERTINGIKTTVTSINVSGCSATLKVQEKNTFFADCAKKNGTTNSGDAPDQFLCNYTENKSAVGTNNISNNRGSVKFTSIKGTPTVVSTVENLVSYKLYEYNTFDPAEAAAFRTECTSFGGTIVVYNKRSSTGNQSAQTACKIKG